MTEFEKKYDIDASTHMQKSLSTVNFPTGCILLDDVIGGGFEDPSNSIGVSLGYPGGKFVNIVGESGSGKTFFACETIVASMRKYGNDKFHYVYDDVEHGFSIDGKGLWGIPITAENHSGSIEQLFTNIVTFIDSIDDDECGIYVVDSMDALTNDDIEEEAEARVNAAKKGEQYDKESYGVASPKFLSRLFFKTLTGKIAQKNVSVFFISQLRDNINAGLYGKKRRKSGGSALDFYCRTILNLSVKERFEKNGVVTGACIEASIGKDKCPRPYRKTYVNIMFDYGIDDISTNIDFIYNLKTEKGTLVSPLLCKALTVDNGEHGEKYHKFNDNLVGYKAMLKTEGLYDEYCTYIKQNNLKHNRETILKFLFSDEIKKAVYAEYFGQTMSRSEMILEATKNRDFRISLAKKAIEKYEQIEKEVKSGRVKYSEVEKNSDCFY